MRWRLRLTSNSRGGRVVPASSSQRRMSTSGYHMATIAGRQRGCTCACVTHGVFQHGAFQGQIWRGSTILCGCILPSRTCPSASSNLQSDLNKFFSAVVVPEAEACLRHRDRDRTFDLSVRVMCLHATGQSDVLQQTGWCAGVAAVTIDDVD